MYKVQRGAPAVPDALIKLPLFDGGTVLISKSDVRRVYSSGKRGSATIVTGTYRAEYVTGLSLDEVEGLLRAPSGPAVDLQEAAFSVFRDMHESSLLHRWAPEAVEHVFAHLWDLNPGVMSNPAAAFGFVTLVLEVDSGGCRIPPDATVTLLGLPGHSDLRP